MQSDLKYEEVWELKPSWETKNNSWLSPIRNRIINNKKETGVQCSSFFFSGLFLQ